MKNVLQCDASLGKSWSIHLGSRVLSSVIISRRGASCLRTFASENHAYDLRGIPFIKNQRLIWFVNNNCKIVLIWAMLIWFPLELESAFDLIIFHMLICGIEILNNIPNLIKVLCYHVDLPLCFKNANSVIILISISICFMTATCLQHFFFYNQTLRQFYLTLCSFVLLVWATWSWSLQCL